MARNNTLLIAAAVVVSFAVGLLLGRGLERGEGELWDSAGNSLVSPDRRNGEEAPRRAFQNLRAADAPRARAEEVESFSFSKLTLETTGDTPRACLQFTKELDQSGETDYGDFIRLRPSIKPALSIAGSTLCLSGLSYDKEYSARLLPGLPSGEGAALERGETLTIAFGDKPAYVGFAGDGVILPRLEADGLGLETVNVEKVEIEVFRISDRALAQKSIIKGEAISADQYYYVYGQEDGEDVGAPVFKGAVDIDPEQNEIVTTVFPLGAALPDLSPGAYFLRMRDASPGRDENRPAQAFRWVIFTDLAITTYSSSEAIDVVVRSINTGRPLQGVDLQLVASNNDLLARVTTTNEGRARFEKTVISGEGVLSPKRIMAFGPQEDFTTLDLQRAPLDLSDRNIGGRTASAVIDGYLYLDRGIYRPGETVRLTGLVRDNAGRASDRPSILRIRKPNGIEFLNDRITDYQIGGFSRDIALPSSSPRGVWSIEIEADGVGVVARERFSVEDFVPQRLAVTIDMDEKSALLPGETRAIGVESRYLYGAPGGDLAVEAEGRLLIDPNPFPDRSGYRFGPVDNRFSERFIPLKGVNTDTKGRANLDLAIDPSTKDSGVPLRLDLVVGVVEPGGRVVRESARIPVRASKRYVGLKLSNGAGGVSQNTPVEIDAILFDRGGAPVAGELEWRIVEEDYWFDWYRENGQWRWRRSYKDVLITEGRSRTTQEGGVRLVQQLNAGSYRITARDPATGNSTDLRFYVGWRSYAAGAESPDQAALTLTSEAITPGARAKFFLDPPYAGEAVIVVATDKVERVSRLRVEEAGREIVIDTEADWGAGFYVMATIVTPRDVIDRPVPRRAMGVAYAPFDVSDRRLEINLEAPEVIRPGQRWNVPITINGTARGEDVMVTLAAVDEGILRLTKFKSPDPAEHYFAKKRLGVDMRDDYGRILNANLGAAANFGGDSIGGEGLSVVPTKTVALFSGLVTVDDDGRAVAPLDIPDFNGELRLMATAWSADKLGAKAQPLTVRDATPTLLSLPRFLAPSDQATASLLIDNVEGEEGSYRVTLSGEGAVESSEDRSFDLAQGQQEKAAFDIVARDVGVGAFTLSLIGPGNDDFSYSYPIEARSPYFPVTEVSTRRLLAGETLSVDAGLLAPFTPGSTSVSVSFSPLQGVDPGPLLDALYRYPYGCSEQLVSSAMPLLYVDVLGDAVGRDADREIRPRVQEAVNKLLDRQSQDGAFGLWREGDSAATGWLGAYVTDFLIRAKAEGYAVPNAALERAYKAMAKVANLDRWSYVLYRTSVVQNPQATDTTEQLRKRAAAYALYVLAKAGRADLSDLRYYHDALIDNVKSPMARAQIGAALAIFGDRSRAINAFNKAVDVLGYDNTDNYYQSPLRDAAGVLGLQLELQNGPDPEASMAAFQRFLKEPNRLHTQEKAFVLLAAQAMLRGAGDMAISRNGQTLDGNGNASRHILSADELDAGVSFANAGDGPIYASVSVYGAPQQAPAPREAGYTVTKRIVARDGKPVDLSLVNQNDRLVVVVSGVANDQLLHPTVIADLLPAGFEIEAILKPEDGARQDQSGPYGWIGEISKGQVAEARDDRFVAALDVRGGERFTFAYVVRAVTSGSFVLPGAIIEDMYRPGVFARSAVGAVEISPAQ